MAISRVDANQAEIVAALRKAGATVQSLASVRHGCPDLLVGHGGENYVIEVKRASGTLTHDERAWLAAWCGHVWVVRSVEEALSVIGVLV